jgi:predicted amidophosphoribosyltransferase
LTAEELIVRELKRKVLDYWSVACERCGKPVSVAGGACWGCGKTVSDPR